MPESPFNKVTSWNACNFIKKYSNAGAFCEHYEIFKNSFFHRTLPVVAPKISFSQKCKPKKWLNTLWESITSYPMLFLSYITRIWMHQSTTALSVTLFSPHFDVFLSFSANKLDIKMFEKTDFTLLIHQIYCHIQNYQKISNKKQ